MRGLGVGTSFAVQGRQVKKSGPLGATPGWRGSSLPLSSSSNRSCQGTISISIPGTERAFLPPGAQPTRPSTSAPGRAGGADRRMSGGRPRLTQEALQGHFSPRRGHGRGPEWRRRGKPRGQHTRRPAPAAESSGVGVHASGSRRVCSRPPGRPPTRKPRPGEGGARWPRPVPSSAARPAPPPRRVPRSRATTSADATAQRAGPGGLRPAAQKKPGGRARWQGSPGDGALRAPKRTASLQLCTRGAL